LALAIVGAVALVIRAFGVGLAAEPTMGDQREADRPAFGALSPDTVALIVTSPGVAANAGEGGDDDEIDDGGSIQSLERKKAPTPAYDGVSVETLRLGIAKSGYLDRCSEGLNDVTVTLKNNQEKAVEGVLVRVFSDNNQSRAAEAVVTSLGAGKSAELGFDNVYIKKGKHKLTATIRLVLVSSPALKAESESPYSATRTIRVKCDDKKDKEESEEA
jgi:hypothetical protein